MHPKGQHIRLPPEVALKLATRIQHATRKLPGQRWEDVANNIGIEAGQLRAFRRGSSVPSLAILYRICMYSGFTPSWFLGLVPLDAEGLHARIEDFNG